MTSAAFPAVQGQLVKLDTKIEGELDRLATSNLSLIAENDQLKGLVGEATAARGIEGKLEKFYKNLLQSQDSSAVIE